MPDGPKAITAGGQLTAHLTDAAHYGITLLLATGSDAHVTGLRAVAAERKLTLDEKGLRRGGKVVAAATEEAIYKALGMQTAPQSCAKGAMRLRGRSRGRCRSFRTDSDIAGILHAHTDCSDGVDTLETMAKAQEANYRVLHPDRRSRSSGTVASSTGDAGQKQREIIIASSSSTSRLLQQQRWRGLVLRTTRSAFLEEQGSGEF